MKNQVRLKVISMEEKIASAIIAAVSGLREIKYATYKTVRITADDFSEIDTPAVQLIDLVLAEEPEKSRTRNTWRIALELIMKSTQYNGVDQSDLWSLCYSIKRAIGAVPNLGIPGVIHILPTQRVTSLPDLVPPYYIAKLEFDILFYETYVREC